LEARGGVEPPIKVLQTLALPLGYRAAGRKKLSVFSNQLSGRNEKHANASVPHLQTLFAFLRNSPD
jgi:hypothetical protein